MNSITDELSLSRFADGYDDANAIHVGERVEKSQ